MFRDLDIKLKILPYAIIVFLGAVFCILYIQVNKEFFDGLFKFFSLSTDDVQGIIVFSIIFFLIVRLVSNSLVVPYVSLNQRREDLTVNKIKEANILLEEASVLEDDFYKKAHEAKRSAMTQKVVILTEARRNAEDIIFQTENEVSSEVASAKERIDLRSKIMLNELVVKKQEFLGLLKEKILNP